MESDSQPVNQLLDGNLVLVVRAVRLHDTHNAFDVVEIRRAAAASKASQPFPALRALALVYHNTPSTLVYVRLEGGLYWEIHEALLCLHEFTDLRLIMLVLEENLLHGRFCPVGGDFTEEEVAEDMEVSDGGFIGVGRGVVAQTIKSALIAACLVLSTLALLWCKNSSR